MKTRFPGMLVMVVSVALVMAVTIEASAGDFYAGKTIKIVVGNPVGGGFLDLYARLVSRHLGIHIPGNPNIILANMPGGGGVAAANHLFQAAKADGLTIGVWNPSFILRQALGDATMAFESTQVPLDRFGHRNHGSLRNHGIQRIEKLAANPGVKGSYSYGGNEAWSEQS